MTQPQYLLLGEVLRPHGVRGELRVRLLTDYPERIDQLPHVYVAEGVDAARVQSYKVQHIRFHQGYGLLKLEGIEDRDGADRLRALFVMVDFANAVPLDDDEVYLYQLIGLNVQTEAGEVLGQITDVLETGANDVYVLDSERYGEILIPITPQTLLKTDTDAGVVTVRLPDGLLPSL